MSVRGCVGENEGVDAEILTKYFVLYDYIWTYTTAKSRIGS